jgi:CBS domain-containing protein/PAS domain-containing protein
MYVSDIASKQLVLSSKSESIAAVVKKMADQRVSSVIIVDEVQQPLGIFTETDLLEVMCSKVELSQSAVEFCTSNFLMVSEHTSVEEAQVRAHAAGARHVLVKGSDGSLSGLLSETDFQKNVQKSVLQKFSQVHRVMDVHAIMLNGETPLSEAIKIMKTGGLDYVLVGEDRSARGILTPRELAKALARGDAWATMASHEWMSSPVVCIHCQEPVTQALEQMQVKGVHHMAVTDDLGGCIGVITQHGLMDRVAEELMAINYETVRSEQRLQGLSFHHMMDHLPVPATYTTIDGVGIYLNRKFKEVLGYDLVDIPTMDKWWLSAYPDPGYRKLVQERWSAVLRCSLLTQWPVDSAVVNVRAKNGKTLKMRVNASVVDEGVVTAFEDMTVSHQQNQLLDFGQKILELVVRGESLGNVARAICEQVENRLPGTLCSVLQLDQQGLLRTIASKNLPQAWLSMIDGLQPGDNVGTCGTAAFHNREVLSSDIAVDSGWTPLVNEALSFNLAACWSMPIKSDQGTCLGTVAVYWDHPVHEIEPFWREILTTGASLASLSFERYRRQTLLDEMYFRLALGEEAAEMGTWSWSESSGTVTLSEQARQMLGAGTALEFDLQEFMWGWVHEADRNKVSQAIHALRQGQLPPAIVFRRHPDLGPVKYLKLTVKQYANMGGVSVGLIGAMLDVTESVQKTNSLNEQLNELRRWQHVMLDREDRVQDLKREVNQLLVNMGQSPKYTAF